MLPRCFPEETSGEKSRETNEGHQRVPKLTQRLVETAKAGDCDIYLWDSEVRGFGLRIKPSGSQSFIVALRIGGRGGQQRRRLIGKPSIISVDKARQQARLMVAEAKSGKDPVAALIAERQKKRLREVVPVFLADYVEVKRKGKIELRHCSTVSSSS